MPITLLIVEDDAAFLDASVLMAMRHLHLVYRAQEGEEAVDILNHYGESINLVILDWSYHMMLVGHALVKNLRQAKPDMRLVLMTDLMESDVRRDLPAGEDPTFLRKPFLPHDLEEIVRLSLRDVEEK